MTFDDNLKATKKILSKMEDEASKMRKKIIEVEKMKVRKLFGHRSVLNSDDEYCSGSSTGGNEDFDAGMALRYKGDLDIKCGLWRCSSSSFTMLVKLIISKLKLMILLCNWEIIKIWSCNSWLMYLNL